MSVLPSRSLGDRLALRRWRRLADLPAHEVPSVLVTVVLARGRTGPSARGTCGEGHLSLSGRSGRTLPGPATSSRGRLTLALVKACLHGSMGGLSVKCP